jgi:hypothetical protein
VPTIAVDCPCAASATEHVDDQKGIPVAGSEPSFLPIFLDHAEHRRPKNRGRSNSLGSDIVPLKIVTGLNF